MIAWYAEKKQCYLDNKICRRLPESAGASCWGAVQDFGCAGTDLPRSPLPRSQIREHTLAVVAFQQLPFGVALNQMIDTFLLTRFKSTMRAVDNQIVRLPAKGYGMMELQLSLDRYAAVVDAARVTAARYFENCSSEPEQPDDDNVFTLLPSRNVIDYIDHNARQQLSYIGVLNYNVIDTHGGAYVGGNVETEGGNFTGRDTLQH